MRPLKRDTELQDVKHTCAELNGDYSWLRCWCDGILSLKEELEAPESTSDCHRFPILKVSWPQLYGRRLHCSFTNFALSENWKCIGSGCPEFPRINLYHIHHLFALSDSSNSRA
jgi:hypothetical protein